MGARNEGPASSAAAFTTAVRKTLRSCEADAEPEDAGIRALLLVTAKSLDSAAFKSNPYAVAALSGRALEMLRELRLTPASRGASDRDDSPLAALLERWSTPALRHPEEV